MPRPEPFRFTVEGVTYEMDLCTEHEGYLRETMEEFTSHARRVGGVVKPQPETSEPSPRSSGGRKRVRRRGIGDFNRDRGIAPDWAGSGRAPKIVEEAFDAEFPEGEYVRPE